MLGTTAFVLFALAVMVQLTHAVSVDVPTELLS